MIWLFGQPNEPEEGKENFSSSPHLFLHNPLTRSWEEKELHFLCCTFQDQSFCHQAEMGWRERAGCVTDSCCSYQDWIYFLNKDFFIRHMLLGQFPETSMVGIVNKNSQRGEEKEKTLFKWNEQFSNWENTKLKVQSTKTKGGSAHRSSQLVSFYVNEVFKFVLFWLVNIMCSDYSL